MVGIRASYGFLVADDSKFMCLACRRILETQEHLSVVAMVADGLEAVSQAKSRKPSDVAILDVRMPKYDGLSAARQITAARPGTGIVMMSNYDDTEYIVELMKDGAAGKAYLLKTSVAEVDELVRAVEGVADGDTVLDPVIVSRLVKTSVSRPDVLSYCLQQSERDVLSMISVG